MVVLEYWEGGAAAIGAAGTDYRDFALKRYHHFDDGVGGAQLVPSCLEVIAGVDAALAFAVVAKFAGFDDGWQADAGDGVFEFGEGGGLGEVGHREAVVTEETFSAMR